MSPNNNNAEPPHSKIRSKDFVRDSSRNRAEGVAKGRRTEKQDKAGGRTRNRTRDR
jgi:hypothetical protein